MDNNVSIKISGLYRCFGLPKDEFIKCMNSFLLANKSIKNHYIVGDFNIDILKTDSDSEQFYNNFLENEYLPSINTITRFNNSGGGTCIDNIFIKSSNLISRSYKLLYNITDHEPIFVVIKSNPLKNVKSDFSLDFINFKKLNDIAKKENWNIYNLQNVNIAFESFLNSVNKVVKKASRKIHNKNISKKARKSWITSGLLKSCNTKQKLYNAWKNDLNNTKLEKAYKVYANKLSNLIKYTKFKFEKKEVKMLGRSNKKLWNFANSKLDNKSKRKTDIKFLNVDGDKIENSNETAELFNKFFSSIGETLTNNIKKPNKEIELDLPKINKKSIY